MKPQTARRFSPIFVATITPHGVETKLAENGDEYVICKGAQFQRTGKDAEVRTVMAFGQSATKVKNLLEDGKPIQLAVQFNRKTIKVIGEPRAEQLAAAARAAARLKAENDELLKACAEAAGYEEHKYHAYAA